MLASARSSFHSCIFCGSIVSQPPSISSTLMPSNRQRTWMRFSYLRARDQQSPGWLLCPRAPSRPHPASSMGRTAPTCPHAPPCPHAPTLPPPSLQHRTHCPHLLHQLAPARLGGRRRKQLRPQPRCCLNRIDHQEGGCPCMRLRRIPCSRLLPSCLQDCEQSGRPDSEQGTPLIQSLR